MEPIIGMILVFSIPLTAIWTSHRRKMLELQMQLKGTNNSNVQSQIDQLRDEMRSLRDTTTQYDVSFDSALQRMEQRVGSLERKANQSYTEQPSELRSGL